MRDHPASEDAFGNKGHERTAFALARAVEGLTDRDGAIGLEGTWGAGKSTVIDIATQHLEASSDKQKYHLFCFDLWAHQTQNLKRAFLDEFLSWLRNDTTTLISNDRYTEFNDRLRDSTKTTTYKVDREIPVFAFIGLILAPLIPVLLAWLGPSAFSGETEQPFLFKFFQRGDLGYTFEIPFASITVALYLALVMVLILRVMADRKTADGSRRAIRSRLYRAIALFDKSSENRTVTEHFRDEDPASLEFQNLFRQIVYEVQHGGKHRLIFVFDNIDRMRESEILEVWAEVRSVFTSAGKFKPRLEAGEEAYAVTAVIPYDRALIQQAAALAVNDSTDGVPYDGGSELIRKTLDITLKVSPPITADWKGFFEAKCVEALHGTTQKQRRILCRLLDLDIAAKGTFPTPRQIISYINEIAILRSQWEGVIPIESVALYVLNKDEIEKKPKQIAYGQSITPVAIREVNQPDWQTHLAALAFNVAPEEALQVLIGPQIMHGLTNRDFESIRELEATRGFDATLADQLVAPLDQDIGNVNPEFLASAAHVLSQFDNTDNRFEASWRLMMQALQQIGTGRGDSVRDYLSFSEIVVRFPVDQKKIVCLQTLQWISNILLGGTVDVPLAKKYAAYIDEFVGLCAYEEPNDIAAIVNQLTHSEANLFPSGIAEAAVDFQNVRFDWFQCSYDRDVFETSIAEQFWSNPAFITKLIGLPEGPLTEDIVWKGLRVLTDKLSVSVQDHTALIESLMLLNSLRAEHQTEVDTTVNRTTIDGTMLHYHSNEVSGENAYIQGTIMYHICSAMDFAEIDALEVPQHPTFGDMSRQLQELRSKIDSGDVSEQYLAALHDPFAIQHNTASIVENSISEKLVCLRKTGP